MDFLQTLKAHKGGLIRLKGELFWYDRLGWDGSPGRVCPVLDTGTFPARAAATTATASADSSTAVLLLIDGCPQWIWVAKTDVELL